MPPVANTDIGAMNYEIDPLATRPYGIGETQVYVFTLSDSEPKGRLIKSRHDAETVDPTHILGFGLGQKVVTLKHDEEPTALSIFIETQCSAKLFRVRFHATYDAGSEKTAMTRALLMAKN